MINTLKAIISFLISQRIYYIVNKKINFIRKKLNIKSDTIDPLVRKNSLTLWKKIDKKHNNKWLEVYTKVNNLVDYKYISERAYYVEVEPKLNNALFTLAYADKNSYSRNLDAKLLPKTLLRKIEGVFYDENYNLVPNVKNHLETMLKNRTKFICKKSTDSGGGREIKVYNLIDNLWVEKNSQKFKLDNLNKQLGDNFILQEYVEQALFFSQFNQTSLNTTRFFTYRSVVDNDVKVLHAMFRMGQPGSLIDNASQGGVCCGVDIESGKLNNFAITVSGHKTFVHNNVTLENKIMPKFNEMKAVVKDIGSKFPYHRILGHDICLDKNGEVKFIEVNNRNLGINEHQMVSGPLFGKYTDEIIDFCLVNKKKLKIDFEI